MTSLATPLAHSHEEQWQLQPGLDHRSRAFAHAILPLLRTVKAALIELGGLALTASGAQDAIRAQSVAARLAHVARRAQSALDAADATGAGLHAQSGMTPALRQVSVWAEAVVADGGQVSRECAAGLGDGYRRLRAAAEVLWRHELVPEGRTVANPGRDRDV
jgi:hypothetical protein